MLSPQVIERSFRPAFTGYVRQAAFLCSLMLGLAVSALPTKANSAASSGQTSTQSAPLKVVTSFSILADMVEQIGGSVVEVQSLVGRDSDAHVFNPTPKDARALANADLVVINGLGFEGWLERLVTASGFKGPVLVASDGIDVIQKSDQDDKHDHDKHDHDKHDHDKHGDHDNHDHGETDPHAWQSLQNAKVYIGNIQQALVELRPASKEVITQRTADYLAQIDTLDQSLRLAFAEIPLEKRKAIVSHDAFNYLARAYGIEFLPVQGWSTGREASAADVAHLIRQVRDGQVHAFFIENMSDARVLERIADETGAKSGGKLYSDALSAPGTEADTYLKLYQVNGQRLIDALK